MSTSQFIKLPTDFTDGDMELWPADRDYNPEDYLYHKKLATKWLDKTRSVVTGEPRFRSLPQGYRVYTRARFPGGVADRYIYGHPNGRFTSPNQFWPHFLWLMSDGKGDCACIRCDPTSTKALSSAADSTKFANRAKRNAFVASVMGEGTQVLNNLVDIHDELRIMATYCDAMEIDKGQKLSVAYDGKHLPADQTLRFPTPATSPEKIRLDGKHHSFEPRIGEIVLFLGEEEGPLSFHRRTQTYLVMKKGGEKRLAFPTWRAGVISELAKGPVAVSNLSHIGDAKDLSGSIMVEIVTRGIDGARSQRSQTIPISRTRPFSMFRELLNGLPQSVWHETVKYALNLVGGNAHCAAYRFEGQYPSGVFQCRAIWIGNELFRPGDAARIITQDNYELEKLTVEDVLVISAIKIIAVLAGGRMSVRYSLLGKKYSATRPSVGAYEILNTTTFTDKDLAARQLPTSMRGYKWYGIPGTHTVGPIQILGRLYEKAAMVAMINSSSLDIGLKGVNEARKFNATERAKQCGKFHREAVCLEWFRDRIQMLDVDNFKNVDFRDCFPFAGLEVVNPELFNFESHEDVYIDREGDHQVEDVEGFMGTEVSVAGEVDILIYPSKRSRTS